MDRAQSRFAMTELGRSLVAGAAGSAVVIGAGLLGPLPAPQTAYATLVGVMMFVGVTLVIPRRLSLRETLVASGDLTGVQAEEVERFVSDNTTHIRLIQETVAMLPEYQELVSSITTWAERIITNVKADPSDISRSGKFEIHLSETALIVEKIADLRKKNRGVDSEIIADIEGKAWVVLEDINDAFEKRYHSNLENNIRDVEVDLQVLKGALDREGL